jgi:hypothetical protein
VLAFVSLALATSSAASPEISGVYHEPAVLSGKQQTAAIHFRLSAPARAAVHLYDGRNLRVRSLGSAAVLPAGAHRVAWDGRDERGRPVPPEAYTYAIEVTDAAGAQVRWDVTDSTGGEEVPVERVRWEPESDALRYALPEPARVRIRIGMEPPGPLLATLVDWAPRAAGAHAEPWDGKDASGVLDLSSHSKLLLAAEAFSLPRNAIVVGPPEGGPRFLDGLDTDARRESTARPRRMYDYASQPIEARRDFPVRLEVLGDPPRNHEGLPRVSGAVPLRISVAEGDLASLMNERCEIVVFVDGLFWFEAETGFLPMTWRWDASGANPGVHYLTVNVRGYEGHFGMGTVKVDVAPAVAERGGES